jgi:hypothetical protein
VAFLDILLPADTLLASSRAGRWSAEPRQGGLVGTELGGSQISSLMETLPGIAQVLRNPVADAIVSLSRAAARIDEFRVADAEELLQYAVRRSLLHEGEADRVMEEVRAANQKRLDRNAAQKAHAKAAPPKARKKAAPVKKVVKAVTKPVKASHPVKKKTAKTAGKGKKS